MKIGILEAGRTSPDMIGQFGSFADMFRTLLGGLDSGLSFEIFAVMDDEFPPSPDDCDAWLVTGSYRGVYDDLAWMSQLKDLIRTIAAGQRPLAGICFGHQIIADALGGRVEKSDKGWGLGPQTYTLHGDAPWRDPNVNTITVTAIHQDQVITPPPGAQVYARSDFCPNAGFTVGTNVMTLQPHPEFTPEFSQALIRARHANPFPAALADLALDDLSRNRNGDDPTTFARWMITFLRQGENT